MYNNNGMTKSVKRLVARGDMYRGTSERSKSSNGGARECAFCAWRRNSGANRKMCVPAGQMGSRDVVFVDVDGRDFTALSKPA
jgi:hypothetical protein